MKKKPGAVDIALGSIDFVWLCSLIQLYHAAIWALNFRSWRSSLVPLLMQEAPGNQDERQEAATYDARSYRRSPQPLTAVFQIP